MLRNALGKTFRFLGYTVQYGCIAHCAFEYLGGIVVCSGPSMEPTIQNSDIVFSENLSRHFYCIRKYAPLLRPELTLSVPGLLNNHILTFILGVFFCF
ncbi:hypothetical protein Nmel_006215 [Mimus melanotis]